MLRSFDLFAGIGGFRLAFENVFKKNKIAFKTVGWSEIDKYCQKTYSSNFDTSKNFFVDDIKKLLHSTKNIATRSIITVRLNLNILEKNYQNLIC